MTNSYIAYCGNDCTQCPQYKQDCTEGCLGATVANYCTSCAVRLCNLEHQLVNCAACGEYPCRRLEDQYRNMEVNGYADWSLTAKTVLSEISRSQPVARVKKDSIKPGGLI